MGLLAKFSRETSFTFRKYLSINQNVIQVAYKSLEVQAHVTISKQYRNVKSYRNPVNCISDNRMICFYCIIVNPKP